jgi:hypothetical protein
MRPGRELDTLIAKEVFEHEVVSTKKGAVEKARTGDRPLRNYSKDISAAWEVAERLSISLLPIDNGQWFALVGDNGKRWTGPAEFLRYLQTGNFVNAGAAVGESAPLTICLAALKAIEHRKKKDLAIADPIPSANPMPGMN